MPVGLLLSEGNLELQGVIGVKFLVSIVWLFSVLSVGAAQSPKHKTDNKPDLSGVWVLDSSRSRIQNKVSDYVLTIVHREPEIRMTKRYRFEGSEHLEEVIYHTDGKPEYNSQLGRVDPEPVTRWRGNKLVRKGRSVPTGISVQTFPPLEVTVTEVWELSTDGKTLMRTLTTSGVILSKQKYVFNRSP